MQENEFEKQVQQKMDDLKLDPSAFVWQKIEPQIKKEKSRRWIFILLPILLIGILYGGYLLLDNVDTQNSTANTSKNEQQSEATKNINSNINNTPQPKENIDSITINQPVTEKQIVQVHDKSFTKS